MALQLPVTLPNGAEGNYIRIGVYEWNREQRSAYAQLALFKDAAQAAAAPRFPLAVVAILNLRNEAFDEYFSAAALAAAAGSGLAGADLIRFQLYKAAKEKPLAPVNDLLLENIEEAEDV
jgi:hypothetical protein